MGTKYNTILLFPMSSWKSAGFFGLLACITFFQLTTMRSPSPRPRSMSSPAPENLDARNFGHNVVPKMKEDILYFEVNSGQFFTSFSEEERLRGWRITKKRRGALKVFDKTFIHMKLFEEDLTFRSMVEVDSFINQGILPLKTGASSKTGEHRDAPRKRGGQNLPWEFEPREGEKGVYDISFAEE